MSQWAAEHSGMEPCQAHLHEGDKQVHGSTTTIYIIALWKTKQKKQTLNKKQIPKNSGYSLKDVHDNQFVDMGRGGAGGNSNNNKNAAILV